MIDTIQDDKKNSSYKEQHPHSHLEDSTFSQSYCIFGFAFNYMFILFPNYLHKKQVMSDNLISF